MDTSYVIGMHIKVHRSEQICAIGAAMFVATAAGWLSWVHDTMQQMGQQFDMEYQPNPTHSVLYTNIPNDIMKYKSIGGFIEEHTTS